MVLMLLATLPIPARGATILLFPQRPRPGDAAMVMVKGAGNPVDLVVRFPNSGEPSRVYQLREEKGERVTLIGIPLKARELLLRVRSHRKIQIAGVRLTLAPRKTPFSRIRLPRRYLTPSRELQKKIAAQRRMLREVLSRDGDYWYPEGPPVIPLSKYRQTTPFGARRVINGVRVSPHSGVDMAAPTGTPVRAVFSGKVVLASHLYYTGNTLVLDHGRGFFTLYAHLKSFSVPTGAMVRKGEVIGKVGATGRATGPHLHLGAYVEGVRVDPLSLFSIPSSLWAISW